jgi:hypothetical protein
MIDQITKNRRQFLAMAGAAGIAGFAGCTTEPQEEEDPEEEEEQEDEEESMDDDEEDPGQKEEEDDEDEDGETEEEYTLTVIVEDETGSPADHARVAIEDDDGRVDGVFAGEDEGQTNMNGEVEAQLPQGEYTVTAEDQDGDEDAERDVTVESDEEVTLTLGMTQYTLTVIVEDGTGEPVEHARVIIEDNEGQVDGVFGEGEDEGWTNTNGVVEPRLPVGEYTVTAEDEDGDRDAEEDVIVEDDGEITLPLGEDDPPDS